MSKLESRLFAHSILIGAVATALVLIVRAMGLLTAPENWLYDLRAAHCQWRAAPPTDKIVHLDIDDGALDAIGRWLWPRERLAQIIDELNLAKPKAVALDILLSEPQIDTFKTDDGKSITINHDPPL